MAEKQDSYEPISVRDAKADVLAEGLHEAWWLVSTSMRRPEVRQRGQGLEPRGASIQRVQV